MASFNRASGQQAQPMAQTTGPLGSATTKKGKAKSRPTFQGGEGVKQNAKSELFLTAVSCMLGEPTFYESADERVARIQKLTAKVTADDPEWVARFVPWLRNTANMRTVSIAVACEYLRAGGPNARSVISSALSRADEPGEALAYWMHFYYDQNPARYRKSPRLPQALRKGVGDAANRIWNEYNVLKYNTDSYKVGMANVLNLTHPSAQDEHTAALFKFIVDSAYGREPDVSALPKIAKQLELRQVPKDQRRQMVTPELIAEAGFTWEQVSGWVGGAWDARLWEAVIPSMPYMALLRNLRNFDVAGISNATVDFVINKLTDPEQVARSRQFPYRFYSAYLAAPSDNWKRALGVAMDLSCQNIPALEGSSLVLVDSSGSMGGSWYGYGRNAQRDSVSPVEKAALFGAALWKKAQSVGGQVDLVFFDTDSRPWNIAPGTSVLSAVADARSQMNGGATHTWRAVQRHYNEHDRVVILSDMQAADNPPASAGQIPFIHAYNLVGYPRVILDGNTPGRYNYGGFSDACFRLMATLEQYSQDWPF